MSANRLSRLTLATVFLTFSVTAVHGQGQSDPLLTLPTRAIEPVSDGWLRGASEETAVAGHGGIDYGAHAGSDVLAPADGWAIASCQPPLVFHGTRVYGNFVLIHYDDGQHSSIFAHLSSF